METSKKLNPIIEQLSRIDKLACDESAKAADKKDMLLDEFESDKTQYSAGLKTESDKYLADLKRQLDEETAQKLARVKEEYAARSAKLDEEFAQNCESWAENIFNTVIEG